jgi:cysteine-S-conjugate beta-lyase
MKYNFDEIVDRSNTNCEKYDGRKRVFGTDELIPLWVADTDFRTPDFIVNAVKKRADHEIYGYPIKPDSYYLSIQRWLFNQHEWVVERSWITYCPNVVVGVASVILSMTKPGDKIIVQPPVYFPFFHVVEGNDRILVENPLKLEDSIYRFDFDDLKSKIDNRTKMLLLCNPHNPGGRVWLKDELAKLARIAMENNILIVSDEIHSDLILHGNKHTPIAILSKEISFATITISSASKTFNIAGLSSAYLVIRNKALMAKYNQFMQATHISSGNFFGMVATEAAYTYGAEWLSQLNDYLYLNFLFIERFFRENIPEIKVMEPQGTFLVWIDISGLGIEPRSFYQKLVNAGVGISPGSLFGTGGENYIRLNMGCPKSLLIEALERFKIALLR